jgi:hypothetical protein
MIPSLSYKFLTLKISEYDLVWDRIVLNVKDGVYGLIQR